MYLRPQKFAFSLIELLTVMAVISLMVGAMVPAVSSFGSTYKRKQTTSLVMNALDQARMAAVRSGGSVHLIFARPQDNGLSEDAMIIVGEPPLGSSSTENTLHTRWIKLPQGVHFRTAPNTLASASLPASLSDSFNNLENRWGKTYSGLPVSAFSAVTFNSSGQIAYPVDESLVLALFEGSRNGASEFASGATAQSSKDLSADGLYEVIRLSRFTGRPRLEVSDLVQ